MIVDWKSVIACSLLVFGQCQARPQMVDSQAPNQNPDEMTNLMTDISALLAEQKQLIREVDDLKRIMLAYSPGKPPLQPTQLVRTVRISGETFRGDKNARVALIEYSDFECPFCGGYEREIYPQIFENYIKTDKVRLFYRDLPLPMHPHAMQAARAAHCANEQGKYWEMHDSLFAKQNALSDPALLDRAKTLALNADEFAACLSSDRYADDIQKSVTEAQKAGIGATPTFFIGTIDSNGDVVNIIKQIVGARPYSDFQAALDEVLKSNSQQAANGH
jgi:protein-disulfide isomerase